MSVIDFSPVIDCALLLVALSTLKLLRETTVVSTIEIFAVYE